MFVIFVGTELPWKYDLVQEIIQYCQSFEYNRVHQLRTSPNLFLQICKFKWTNFKRCNLIKYDWQGEKDVQKDISSSHDNLKQNTQDRLQPDSWNCGRDINKNMWRLNPNNFFRHYLRLKAIVAWLAAHSLHDRKVVGSNPRWFQ